MTGGGLLTVIANIKPGDDQVRSSEASVDPCGAKVRTTQGVKGVGPTCRPRFVRI